MRRCTGTARYDDATCASGPTLVWGGGAIGGTIAGYLARAGEPVVLVDVNRDHVAAINRDGLSMAGRGGSFRARLPARHPSHVTGRFGLVLLCVKAHQTEAAIDRIAGLLAPDGVVVSLQNGLCELTIMQVVGMVRTIGATINFGAYQTAPGEVLVGNSGTIVVGELDGRVTPRARAVARLLGHFEPGTMVTDNIWGYLWGKVAYSTLIKASALDNAPMSEFFTDPRWRALQLGLVREVLRVARAENIAVARFDGFDPSAFEAETDAAARACLEHMATFFRASAKPQSTVWQDLAVLKRKTDAPAQLAPVFALADRHCLPVPLNRKLVELIRAVEDGDAIQGQQLLAGLAASVDGGH